MDSFVLLVYASLAASRTLLQWLLACLNFTLDSEDLSFWCKQKKWFLWTMAAAQAAEAAFILLDIKLMSFLLAHFIILHWTIPTLKSLVEGCLSNFLKICLFLQHIYFFFYFYKKQHCSMVSMFISKPKKSFYSNNSLLSITKY